MSELTIENLCCACCADDIEAAVRAIPGVRRARVDLGRSALVVEGPATGEEISNAARAVGYRIAKDRAGPSAAELAHTADMAPVTAAQRPIGCSTSCRTRRSSTSTNRHRPPSTRGWATTCRRRTWPGRWRETCATASSSRSS